MRRRLRKKAYFKFNLQRVQFHEYLKNRELNLEDTDLVELVIEYITVRNTASFITTEKKNCKSLS